ncbi:ribosome-inactivating family protein [Micromonospora sp. WMMD987]|uniref:ribosome-inactivating family protein n=1 Tax=Micromonospora sp. WMMD987 TaxID=3016089 RepID=UPI00249A1D63|nr:ribosome-inactivating family protein [Micromonospora sp. WMMD987]WFE97400.1 ribosome-inactivating family protein [Micromonospora sp. WMMD987]
MEFPYARPLAPTGPQGRRRWIAAMTTFCALIAALLFVPAAPASAVDDYPSLDLDDGSSTEYVELLNDIKAEFDAGPISDQPDPLVVMTEFNSHGVFPVELSYLGDSVYLIISRDDLYVVGYYRPDVRTYFYFSDRGDRSNDYLPPGATAVRLRYGSVYQELADRAGLPRFDRVRLGRSDLRNAVTTLVFADAHSQEVAHALLVTIQMVAEAARFREVRQFLVDNWLNSRTFDAYLADLVHRWRDLSVLAYYDQWRDRQGRIASIIVNGRRFDSAERALAVLDIARGCRYMRPLDDQRRIRASGNATGPLDDCLADPARYVVTISGITFYQPGDAGHVPEPYGYLDVSYGFTPKNRSGAHEWSRFWSYPDADFVPTLGRKLSFFDRIFSSETGEVCFTGNVADRDGNLDDQLTPTSDNPAVVNVCGTGGKAELRSPGDPEAGVTIEYEVHQLIECTDQDFRDRCRNYQRDFYTSVYQIRFEQSTDDGSGPEPYGFIKLVQPPAEASVDELVWHQELEDLTQEDTSVAYPGYVNKQRTSSSSGTLPTFEMDVKDLDDFADDQLNGSTFAYGTKGVADNPSRKGNVTVLYELFRIVASGSEVI